MGLKLSDKFLQNSREIMDISPELYKILQVKMGKAANRALHDKGLVESGKSVENEVKKTK
ncbi:hypothetical protein [Maridesulfovibrio bastinii]|uniref:hypothetical protein n=1 Tax=Maridesulfovibrio bastinii TaxID=47157 RepID=UPI0012EC6237|nr:hypothetical protein [Maridesulfovibrio bastinii]